MAVRWREAIDLEIKWSHPLSTTLHSKTREIWKAIKVKYSSKFSGLSDWMYTGVLIWVKEHRKVATDVGIQFLILVSHI